MPDHIHLFVGGGHEFKLGIWVRGLKRVVSAAITVGRVGKDSAAETAAATTFSVGKFQSLWQRGFFDHLIRNTESYAQKWDYVRENPVRAGLVASSDAWEYQGEIALIDRV
jgi:REP-associated tyrosine transposase